MSNIDQQTSTQTIQSKFLLGDGPSAEWLAKNAPIAMYAIDTSGNITLWSSSAERIFGWTADEVLGRSARRLILRTDVADVKGIVDVAMTNGSVNGRVVKRLTKSGSVIDTIIWVYPLVSEIGLNCGFVVFATEDFRTTQLHEDLASARTTVERVVANADLGIFAQDIAKGMGVFGSEGAEKIYGYSEEEFKADPWLWMKVIHPDDVHIVHATPLAPPLPVKTEYRIVRKDGEIRWISNSLYPTFDEEGTPVYVEGVTLDVTERRLHQEKLHEMAYSDALTHLPNRRQFDEDVKHLVDDCSSNVQNFAVLFVDFDGFKFINDTYGHQFADDVLQVIAERMKALTSPRIGLYRVGGDEFMLVTRHVGGIDDVAKLANECVNRFRDAIMVGAEPITVHCSVGLAIFPLHGSDIDILLRNADIAMYTAKERGGHQYCIYSDELVGEYRDRLRLHNLLTHAVVEHEFELFYQPIVHAGNGSLLGAEALIRWNSPILGRVSPLSFIPFAEQSGLIWGIGEWVLRTACKQAKEWRMKGYAPFYVSVNVSMIQFEDPRFFSLVQQVLEEFALEPKWLCLEITESVVVRNPKYVCALVEKLYEIGIRVSMDDFGIGNSSLQYLSYMHVHTLKIDKSFLTDLETTERSVDVVASIIALAHTLRMQVVAEGVERGEQWDILNRHGCDSIQGYYVARPQPLDEFNEFLRRRQDVKKIWMDVSYHGA